MTFENYCERSLPFLPRQVSEKASRRENHLEKKNHTERQNEKGTDSKTATPGFLRSILGVLGSRDPNKESVAMNFRADVLSPPAAGTPGKRSRCSCDTGGQWDGMWQRGARSGDRDSRIHAGPGEPLAHRLAPAQVALSRGHAGDRRLEPPRQSGRAARQPARRSGGAFPLR